VKKYDSSLWKASKFSDLTLACSFKG